MKRQITIAVASLFALHIAACNRTDEAADMAGKGGNATLRLTPMHHSDPIDSCKVYIKYNTLDAANSYDDSTWATAVGGVPVATFSGLRSGRYYIFGKGWDASIGTEVRGGLPVTISEQRVHNLTLPVTEVH